MKGDIERCPTATAIDDCRSAHHVRTSGARNFDCLLRRAACRHHVFDHEDAVAGRKGETAPQRQRAILAFCEDGTNAERSTDFLADDDAAERGGQDNAGVEGAYALRNGRAARLRVSRMLQHERALKITGAVQSGCQPEVALEQRPSFAKSIKNGFGW